MLRAVLEYLLLRTVLDETILELRERKEVDVVEEKAVAIKTFGRTPADAKKVNIAAEDKFIENFITLRLL